MKFSEAKAVYDTRYRIPSRSLLSLTPTKSNTYDTTETVDKTVHPDVTHLIGVNGDRAQWANDFTIVNGTTYYMSFYIYVTAGSGRQQIGFTNTAVNHYMWLRFEADGTIDFQWKPDDRVQSDLSIGTFTFATWQHFILKVTFTAGNAAYQLYKDNVSFYTRTQALGYTGDMFSTMNAKATNDFYFDRLYTGTSFSIAQDPDVTGLILKDGDQTSNFGNEDAGFFRNIGSPNITPVGIGIMSMELDKAIVNIYAKNEDDLETYRIAFVTAFENTTDTGAMWRITEDAQVLLSVRKSNNKRKRRRIASSFNPQYQRTIIIERSRMI